ncbi:MAG: inorganic phosphate transporter [Leptospirales bacterium]
MTLAVITLLIAFLAFSNGANDVSKGVATLFGGGVAQSRLALLWGMAGNVSGGLVAILVGGSLVQTFGGGLLSSRFEETGPFMVAVVLGAAGWVFLSTLKGWPVSTTHALIGGMMGAALTLSGTESFRWNSLWGKAIFPLLLSPLLAMGLTFVLMAIRKAIPEKIEDNNLPSDPTSGREGGVGIRPEKRPTRVWLMHGLHWVSAGATSFARGLNDVPKMAALLIVAWAGEYKGGSGKTFVLSIVLVSVVMGVGGIWQGFRILNVLSLRVTPLTPSTGMIANLSTAFPTLLASSFGLPVSTTHVSAGALFGIRVLSGKIAPEQDALRSILGAWLVTFPASAVISGLFTLLFTYF